MISIKLSQACISTRNKTECRYIPHSLNHRMHWSKRSKWNKAWKDLVYWSIMERRKELGIIPYKFASITIVHHTCHPLDRDNAYTAAKSIIDGIVLAGVIPDDTDQYLDLKVQVNKISTLKDQGVEIQIL